MTDTISEVDAPTESETETVVSLDSFWTAVTAIDTTAPDYDGAIVEYDKLPRGAKMKANHGVKARVFSALDEDNFILGKVLSGLSKAIAANSGASDPGADPSDELVQRMAGIYLAYESLSKSNESLGERVRSAVESGRTDPKSIPATLCVRLVETKMGRKAREGSGTRHNPGKHIAQVFASLPDGTFLSVKELADAKSEEYGDDAATQASIGTHLNSGKFEQVGLSVVTESKGDKVIATGVRKGETPEA